MAARKELIWQRDFSLGAVRPEAVEREDTDLVSRSTKEAENTVTLATGQIEQRPGTVFMSATTAVHAFEVTQAGGDLFELSIRDGGLDLIDLDGAIVHSEAVDWINLAGVYRTPTFANLRFWVQSDPSTSTIIIGTRFFPPQRLYQDSQNAWQFGEYNIRETTNGVKDIPFWKHYPGVRIEPSNRAQGASITVTADDTIWRTSHEGVVIRYNGRQIRLDNRVSNTVMDATNLEELPDTVIATMRGVDGFAVDDVVEGQSSGATGVIMSISGLDMTILYTNPFEGFESNERLIGPNVSDKITSLASSPDESNTDLWDMQLWNPHHGYPGGAAQHGGRLYFVGFPETPNVFVGSVAQDIRNFEIGVNDGDAFAESLGNKVGLEIRHVISAEDLLFMTSHGLYYQGTRDGAAITPTSINPVQFSRFGCSDIAPVLVDDGAVFVSTNDSQVHAAVLAGDIYRSWRVQPLSSFHSHLIERPVALGATSSGSERPEMFIAATLANGDAALCQWSREENIISWRPWTTQGDYIQIYQLGTKLHALVERFGGGSPVSRERFEYGAFLDATSGLKVDEANRAGIEGEPFLDTLTSAATHFSGTEATVYFEGYDMGDVPILGNGWPDDGLGEKLEYPDGTNGFAQIGLSFPVRVLPWPRRSANTQRGLRDVKRLVDFYFTVQETSSFEVNGRPFGGYRAGEDVTLPPPLRSEQFRREFLGGSAYEQVRIVKERPGPFRLLKLGYEVVV